MEILRRLSILAVLASGLPLLLAGCSSGELTTLATSVVETQRDANLTLTTLSGTWKGQISTPDGVVSQAIILIFTQDAGFSLDGSQLVGEDIRLGGVVSRDTFALANGVFIGNELRFNLADKAGGAIILAEGSPVLFTGLLSENDFMSGQAKASSKLIGLWQLRLSTTTP